MAKAAAKKQPAAQPVKAKPESETPAAAPAAPVLRRKELVERVAAASGAKKKDVRAVVEATLKVLGEALAADETLALPPFGKARVNRHRDTGSGEMLTVKLRRAGGARAAKPAQEALAETGE